MSSHLHAQKVSQADLGNVVADELVVLQIRAVDTGIARFLRRVGLARGQLKLSKQSLVTTYHLCAGQGRVEAPCVLKALWSNHALTPSRDHALRCCGGASVVRRVSQDLHWIAQLSLAEKKKSLTARVVRATVVGGFGRHVGQVDSLVKHVSIDGSLGWSNTETLSEDTTVVGSAGAVPEVERSVMSIILRTMQNLPEKSAVTVDLGEHAILEALFLAFTLDAENVEDFIVHVVGGTACLQEVVTDTGELICVGLKRCHLLHAQALEARVKWVDVVSLLLLLHDEVGILEVSQAFQKLDLSLQLLVSVDDRRTVTTEGVRNGRVVEIREVLGCLVSRHLIVLCE